jgi:hypothetical protein
MEILAFCEIPKITEMNFFRREFNLIVDHVESIADFEAKQAASGQNIVVVVSNNPSFWIRSLNKFPKESVVFILIGNETYDPAPYNSVNEINSLKHSFIYNPPKTVSNLAILGSILGNFNDGGIRRSKKPGNLFREGRIAQSLKNKFAQINMSYSYSELPQGYSNSFAEKISKVAGIGSSESLLLDTSFASINNNRSQEYSFTFLGQDGNRRRENFLRVASNFDQVHIMPFESGFGGNNQDSDFTYINLLLSSKFILIPPGLFNNSNHRYTESLIVQSVPVILANNSLDPSDNNNWTKNLSFMKRYSAKSLIRYLSDIDEETYANIYAEASKVNFNHIYDTKRRLGELFS